MLSWREAYNHGNEDNDKVASSPLLGEHKQERHTAANIRVEPYLPTRGDRMMLRDLVRDRLLVDMVRGVKQATKDGSWLVMCVDPLSLRILSAACRNYDIMEEGVTLVEKITVPRQPLPHLTAVYFLTPTPESVSALINDYKDKKRTQYGPCHVFFTSALPSVLMSRIKETPNLLSHIRGFKEFNLEFLATESTVYSLDLPDNMKNLYSDDNATSTAKEIRKVANQLYTLCATLGENPIIRYRQSGGVCNQIASSLHDMLEKTKFPVQSSRPRAQLLIVDRSLDPLAPLLHEFTYQAMVHDLLKVDGERYKFKYVNNANQEEEKEVLLNEYDQLWPTLRHMHIQECINYVLNTFNEFIESNKTAQLNKKQVNDLTEMRDAVAAMPQYKEMLSKYSLHISMTQECMKRFKDEELDSVAMLEQNMAMGQDPEGNSLKNLMSDLTNVLQSPSIPKQSKLRLLMTYIITQEGIKDQDRNKLLEMAGLNDKDTQAITNLFYLGVTLAKGKKSKSKSIWSTGRRTSDVSYDLSRYQPLVKDAMESMVKDTLPESDYPYVRKPSGNDSGAFLDSVGKSVRSHAPKWAQKNKKKEEDAGPALTGGRLIVFVAGGVSMSEIRAAYEVSKSSNREVIIGSALTLTPATYIENLSSLKAADDGFDLHV
eukprot:GFYU01001599.1.p1 GENE.GFYU01001599.1~~GFYU01001599.1.p1  ORF type:complete len:657 (-),score=150.51 GFYU01001599.1:79-2049(-)